MLSYKKKSDLGDAFNAAPFAFYCTIQQDHEKVMAMQPVSWQGIAHDHDEHPKNAAVFRWDKISLPCLIKLFFGFLCPG